jgi:outer membrane receptor for ferrienterochelin and colicin
MRILRKHLIAVMIVLLALPLLIMAGTTGKIAGIVIDSKSGEAIHGATVRVLETGGATQTDSDGEYFFINLPAGNYTVSVTTVGFQTVRKENVRVLLDLTTPADFSLEQVDIPIDRQVRVYAVRLPIQKDLTASRSIITSDRLISMPNGTNVQSIIANMAGTVIDNEDNLHVRGGRSGTVSYFYDGFSVQDPFVGTAGIRIMPDALEEINLTSGGFAAEYGEALSGIINAVSKEGTRDFHGRIKLYDGYTHRYDVNTGELSQLSRNKNNAVAYNLMGPIPALFGRRSAFFLAGEYRRDGGYLPHNEMNQFTHAAKLNLQPTPNMKFVLTGSYYRGSGEVYDHRDVNDRSYDFNLDGLGIYKSEAYLYGLKGNYNISQKTVLALAYNHFYTESKRAPEHLFDIYWSEWPGYSVDSNGVYNGTIQKKNYRLAEEYLLTGFTFGDDFVPIYHERYTGYHALTGNLTSQIDKHNQLRIGGEYRDYRIFWDEKQFFNDSPYGEKYRHSPVYATLYSQEKLELRDFIINAGLRYDYLNSQVVYWEDVINKDKRVKSSSKTQISPRLGVSHPITENSMIRFNYGYFFQVPNYIYMYTNLDGDINSGLPLVGNPDLKAEKTIAYELGLNHMLNQDLRLDITVYYKDIKDLIATRAQYLPGSVNPITKFVNEDYGSVKGMDVTIEKVARGNFSGSLVYSYMIAKGNSSSAREGYYKYIANTTDTVLPVQEFPLSYDQRHTATISLEYRAPRDWHGKMFGVDIPGDWGVNMTGHYGSGMPYTVTDNVLGFRLGNVNEGRMPATYSVDLRFNKYIFMTRSATFLSFFVEVENLFNRRNVINVYGNTGRADDDGRFASEATDPEADLRNHYYKLMANDPQNYSAPRRVRVGLEFNF